jgi:oligoendopeptidase F
LETPFTLAEVAALFFERLVFETLLEDSDSEIVRRTLIYRRIHDLVNTAFRHMALYDFEIRSYERRETGLVSAEELEGMYEQVHKEALGESLIYGEGMGSWYITVPHFFNWPFYTYAYAFGEIMAALLAADLRRRQERFKPDFRNYLTSGGLYEADKILAPMAGDLDNFETWTRGLKEFLPLLDDLEALI